MRKLGCFGLAMILWAGAALAAGPGAITYQGSLLNLNGLPIPTGIYNMSFTIFDAPSGGTPRFSINKNGVTVAQGFFSVDLDGAGSVFRSFNNLWLEIGVDLDTPPNGIQFDEIYQPRQRLTAAPYSESATQADNALNLGGIPAASFIQDGVLSFTTRGPGGSLNTFLGGNLDNAELGFVGVFDASGQERGNMQVDVRGHGTVNLFGVAGGAISALTTRVGAENFGSLQLFGTAGLRAEVFVDTDNTGGLRTLGQAGNLATFVGSTLSGPDRGSFEAYDTAGALKADLFVDTDLTGASRTFGADGFLNTFVGSTLASDNFGAVEVYDSAGMLRGEMFADTVDRGIVRTYGANGNAKVALTTVSGAPNFGAIGVFNSTGAERASVVVSPTDGSGSMAVRGPSGNVNAALFSVGDNGSVDVNDPGGNNKGTLQVTAANSGGLTLRGDNGTPTVIASTVSGGPNRGAVAVFDGAGSQQATMFVDTDGLGKVIADVKNFVADHPKKPGVKIIYTSLEGPEAAMYCRGTARLADGRATITLPEHFSALANPATITVQLTPGSFDSKGVAVGTVTADTIEIGELLGGTGNYDVHYLVHAVRAGFEDMPVEQTDAQFKTSMGVEPGKGRDEAAVAKVDAGGAARQRAVGKAGRGGAR